MLPELEADHSLPSCDKVMTVEFTYTPHTHLHSMMLGYRNRFAFTFHEPKEHAKMYFDWN
jgi:hypothetical protein